MEMQPSTTEMQPSTTETIVWIEIPADANGRLLCAALKENMIDTWLPIGERFIEDFLNEYNDVKIKTVELFDGVESIKHRFQASMYQRDLDDVPRLNYGVLNSSVLRVVFDATTKQDGHSERPIRWMPASPIEDAVDIRSCRMVDGFNACAPVNWAERSFASFPNPPQWAVGEGEQIALVFHREYVMAKRTLLRPDIDPDLLLYVHWRPVIYKEDPFSGVFSSRMVIYNASVANHNYVDVPAISSDEAKLQKDIEGFRGAIRSVRFDIHYGKRLDFTTNKPTKSAAKVQANRA